MNYFTEGCILLLNDFSDFCKQCNEDFDVEHVKSLVVPFLQSRQTMQVVEVSDKNESVIPVKSTKSLKTKPASRKAAGAEGASVEGAGPRGGSKNNEISVDEFNKLSIKEIESSAWHGKILVNVLKNLCTNLGLPVTKLTKTQIIHSLIKYKTEQKNTTTNEDEPENEAELPESSKQKPKRRVIASAIVKPVVTMTRKHDLNLVFCDNEDVILVLSENNQLCGFIPKEEYNEDDMPNVLRPTKDVLRVAKNTGIVYEVPETIE